MVVSEQRRNPQLSYKSDIIFVSGLDEGDKRELEKHYKGNDPPCQIDPEDDRFIMKGPRFNPTTVINVLAKEKGYKLKYPPQQRSIPLKAGSTDDKFAIIYFLSKPLSGSQSTSSQADSAANAAAAATGTNEPDPPERFDSLPDNPPDIISDP